MEVQGQATQQPEVQQAPRNALEAVSAALDRDEPEFQKAQERANKPGFDEETPKTEQKAEPEKPKEQEVVEQEQEEEITLDLDAPLIETKYKGDGGDDKVEKLSIKQLQSGYMMQRDYQRKTQELAKQREALAKEIESKTKPVLETYEKNLTVMQQALMAAVAPELQGVNLMQLAQDDPAAYVQKKARLDQVGQLYQHINSELTKAQQAKAQQEQLEKQQKIQSAVETLQTTYPDWHNGKYQELMKYGVDFGYTPQEMAEVIDPRVFKLLDAAKKYESLQKAKPEMEKKVVTLPKVLKPGTADKNDKADRTQEKWARLKKEGSREAAASVIYDML
jgi:hypothetical protein